ncbi:hypothetical protein HMPREF9302_10365 [Prevotella amnii DNF00058]|uniref:Uncharacterized protein n=2 Tax=Prevotella amnii TaxID=419005 RepID=A0A096C521_9BACT|nr:hypothetical protein HMPREF9302_10365 [Prevotella amnii DNF00058]
MMMMRNDARQRQSHFAQITTKGTTCADVTASLSSQQKPTRQADASLSQPTSTKIIILCGLDKHYLYQHKLIHDNSL